MMNGLNIKTQVGECVPIVRIIAWQLRRRYDIPLHIHDDLVQEGLIGVLEALGRFDPGRGVAFKTYAQIVVQGRMIDYLRRECRHRGGRIDPDDYPLRQPTVESVVLAREELALLASEIRRLPFRRRTFMEALAKLQPVEKAAARVSISCRKGKGWRRQFFDRLSAKLVA